MNIQEIVEQLNHELYERHGEEEFSFYAESNGYVESISFEREVLWHSEYDERGYGENGDQEDLLLHVKRQFNKWADKLTALKFKGLPKEAINER